jgi:hypothetical protein
MRPTRIEAMPSAVLHRSKRRAIKTGTKRTLGNTPYSPKIFATASLLKSGFRKRAETGNIVRTP